MSGITRRKAPEKAQTTAQPNLRSYLTPAMPPKEAQSRPIMAAQQPKQQRGGAQGKEEAAGHSQQRSLATGSKVGGSPPHTQRTQHTEKQALASTCARPAMAAQQPLPPRDSLQKRCRGRSQQQQSATDWEEGETSLHVTSPPQQKAQVPAGARVRPAMSALQPQMQQGNAEQDTENGTLAGAIPPPPSLRSQTYLYDGMPVDNRGTIPLPAQQGQY